MTGTSKVVDEIIGEFYNEIDKEDDIPKDFKVSLKKVLNDSSKVTASKLEKILYPEDDL